MLTLINKTAAQSLSSSLSHIDNICNTSQSYLPKDLPTSVAHMPSVRMPKDQKAKAKAIRKASPPLKMGP